MIKSRSIQFVILPYLTWSKESANNNTRSVLAFPYGVLSIASYIKAKARNNPKIDILDLNLYPLEDIPKVLIQTLEKNNPDVVGVSMMFDLSYKHLNWISKQIKDYDNEITVVVGGCAATVSWNMILHEQGYVDALCYGEGECPMFLLVDSDGAFSDTFANTPAWVTQKSLDENRIPQPLYVENLNDVINVDYKFIDVTSYRMKEAFSPFSSIKEHREINQFYLVTSRGCPFECVFCSGPSLHGKKIRYADVDVLVAHVDHLVKEYGLNVLTIYDDQILLNRPRAKEFFRRLANYKIRVETPNGMSVAFIDEEMATVMKIAGIDTVPLAIESGSSRMLNDVIHKPLRLEQVKPVVDMLQRNEIFVQGYFVVGLPGELEEDRIETVRFINEVGLDWSGFNLAAPVRGSELYEICKEKGYIDPNYGIGELGMHDYVINAPNLNPADIKRKRYLMNLDVNFVNNHRMRVGDYKIAILCFKDVISRYPFHAFAHYYLAKAQEAMNESPKLVELNRNKYIEIIKDDAVWKEYAEYFSLEIYEKM